MHIPFPELASTARVVSLPLRTRFRGIDVREAMLLRGPAGWTEFSPFVEYGDEEASVWLRAAIDFGWNDAPAAGRVRVNATLPVVSVDRVPDVLARFPGARTVKVKVADPASTVAEDAARVAAVRRSIGPEGRIRVDANGAWTVDEAEHAIHAFAVHDLEYVEQPCATLEDMAEIRRRVKYMGVPIAADESVRKAADPLAVVAAGAADILVLKAQPLGGIRAALRIAKEAGLPVVVSSALETSVGISMGAHLAVQLGTDEYDAGLGTAALLAADITASPLLPTDGAIDVRRIEPDEDLLERHTAPPERQLWWMQRLERCAALPSPRD
ncbi:MAG: o-succinylbenzoate synthase [Actinomycetota bacterium]|nr:o-succinylbenzoate synthase [Actinomycetota bacterium]